MGNERICEKTELDEESDISGRAREKPGASLQKFPIDRLILKLIERTAGDENQIGVTRHQILMVAKDFPQPAFRPISLHGIANRRPGSHKSGTAARHGRETGIAGSRPGLLTPQGPQNKTAAMIAAAMAANLCKFRRTPQVRLGAETHDRSRVGTLGVLRELRRRTSAYGLYGGGR